MGPGEEKSGARRERPAVELDREAHVLRPDVLYRARRTRCSVCGGRECDAAGGRRD